MECVGRGQGNIALRSEGQQAVPENKEGQCKYARVAVEEKKYSFSLFRMEACNSREGERGSQPAKTHAAAAVSSSGVISVSQSVQGTGRVLG